MKIATAILFGALVTSSFGALLAYQQGVRFPGERGAGTSILLDADEGDELNIRYNTLQFGPMFAQNLLSADEQAREQFAAFVPQRLNARFDSDLALEIAGHKLAAGSYGLTFLAGGNGGLDIRFLRERKTVLQVPLEMVEGGDQFDFLSFNLRSAGAESFVLTMDYGSLKGKVVFGLAEEDEEDGAAHEGHDHGDDDGGR